MNTPKSKRASKRSRSSNSSRPSVRLIGVARLHTELEIFEALEVALGYAPYSVHRPSDPETPECPGHVTIVKLPHGDSVAQVQATLEDRLKGLEPSSAHRSVRVCV